MGDIDRQRVAAVKTLQELGLIWSQGAWQKVPQGELVVAPGAREAEPTILHRRKARRRFHGEVSVP
jgi:hypothetical protein